MVCLARVDVQDRTKVKILRLDMAEGRTLEEHSPVLDVVHLHLVCQASNRATMPKTCGFVCETAWWDAGYSLFPQNRMEPATHHLIAQEVRQLVPRAPYVDSESRGTKPSPLQLGKKCWLHGNFEISFPGCINPSMRYSVRRQQETIITQGICNLNTESGQSQMLQESKY